MDRWTRNRGQELPPAAGFPAVPHARSLPPRGPPSWVLLSAAFLSIYAGMFLHSRSRRTRTELARERLQREIMLRPALLAEEDAARLREHRRLEQEMRAAAEDGELPPSPYHNPRLFPMSNPLNRVRHEATE